MSLEGGKEQEECKDGKGYKGQEGNKKNLCVNYVYMIYKYMQQPNNFQATVPKQAFWVTAMNLFSLETINESRRLTRLSIFNRFAGRLQFDQHRE